MKAFKYLLALSLFMHLDGAYAQTPLPGREPTPKVKQTSNSKSKKSNTKSARKTSTNTPNEKAASQLLITFDADRELKIDGISKGDFGREDIFKANLSPGDYLVTFSNGTDLFKKLISIRAAQKEVVDVKLMPEILKRDPLYELKIKTLNGDSIAMCRLAGRYKDAGNMAEALKLYQKSCNLGHGHTCDMAGYYTEDASLSTAFYKRGAELGHRWAMANYRGR